MSYIIIICTRILVSVRTHSYIFGYVCEYADLRSPRKNLGVTSADFFPSQFMAISPITNNSSPLAFRFSAGPILLLLLLHINILQL